MGGLAAAGAGELRRGARGRSLLWGARRVARVRVGELAHFVMVPEKTFGRKGRYPAVPGYSKESPRGAGRRPKLFRFWRSRRADPVDPGQAPQQPNVADEFRQQWKDA